MQAPFLQCLKSRFVGLGLVALLTAASSRAGTIRVVNLPATGTDAASGISPTNTYLCCLDFGNNPSPPGTLNGVPFSHPDLGNQTLNAAQGVDANHGGSYSITSGGPAECKLGRATSTTPAGQADGNTWKLLNDMIYTGSAAPVNSWLNQSYGGLTVGGQYTLRLYYRQWSAPGPRAINISFNGEGVNEPYSGNPLNQDAGGAHYIEYAFTAAATNVLVGMTNLFANQSALVYGVTLEDNSPPHAPVITQQPAAALAGSSLVFSMSASGTAPLAYQWYGNTLSNYGGATALTDGQGVSGARTPTLSSTTRLQDYYFVVVTNPYGSTTSALTAGRPAPLILTQPAGATQGPGTSFRVSVEAAGVPPLAYQWYQDGVAVAGATNAVLAYGYVRASHAGAYQVVVSNAYGAATSSLAPLVVAGPEPVGADFTPSDAALVEAAAQAQALAAAADAAQATTNWSARWVGPPAAAPNLWLCYRKSFSLPDQPASAIARIATDSKYWLWVNGHLAVREGQLKRDPNPTDTWYDQVDLAPWLQAGSNTLALLQWYFGRTGFSHLGSGTAGLLFELNAGGTRVSSDPTWRLITNTAFQLATTVAQPNFRLSESSLRYDARLEPGAWTDAAFDDSAWSHPVDLGAAGGAPWGKLWLRPLPFWQELPLQDFVSNTVTVAGSAPAVWTCYLPVNEQFTPWLELSDSAAGQIITIQPDAAFNGGAASISHEYVTRSGRQSFEFPGWINGHSVQFTVPAGVSVSGLKFRPHLATTRRLGSFVCDDPFFNTLWDKAANTLGVNMMDTWGEPNRERANWIGDSVLLLGQVPYAYDPLGELISRKSLLALVQWQRADQTLFAPAPANYKELPVQVLAALGKYGVWRYYRNTGDLAFLKQCYPALKSYLLNVWQINSQGLVIHRTGQWDWGDWGDNIDRPLLDNTWYLLALEAAAQMAPLVGQPLDAPAFLSRAQGIRNQFNASFWTGSGYRSPAYTGQTDERGNALAVLAGLSSPSQAAALRTVLNTQQHCSPYMEKYVLEALFALGYPDDALGRMRARYRDMVTNSVTTLWELFPASGGFNHGWSGGPLTLLDEAVAGVTPTSPAFATFEVRPALGTTLNRADASIPSPHGLIAISAARNLAAGRLSVRVPPGSSGRAFQPAGGGLLSGAVLAIDGGATAVMDDIARPSQLNVLGGNATLVTNVQSTGTLHKTGSGTLYLGSSAWLSVGGFEVLAGHTIVTVGGQLLATKGGDPAADGHLTVGPGAALENQGGSITCSALSVFGTFEENTGGALAVTGSLTNQGTLRLLGDAQLSVGGPFLNQGVLDIMGWNGTLPAGLVNRGVLLDRSALKVESCKVEGRDLKITLMGYSGHCYQLQSADSLHPASWVNLGLPQPGTQARLVFTETNAVALGQRFYRVALSTTKW